MSDLTKDWYKLLVDDCKAIITEQYFIHNWALVECYWSIGKRIREDINFQKFAKGNQSSLSRVSKNIGVSERNLYRAIQAYDKYPDINEIPEGKNITWKKLVNDYLPEPKKEEAIPLPEGKFNVIYADPPWRYEHSKTKTREIENQYPTMDLEDIKALEVPSAEDSILFLWSPAPKLEEAIGVMNAWGFNYRTCAVWDKEIIGMGYWFRSQHELLLVGVKGSFSTPEEGVRFPSVFKERRGEHSKKPDYYYKLIQIYFPEGKYLELFARSQYNDKWTVWGNEL